MTAVDALHCSRSAKVRPLMRTVPSVLTCWAWMMETSGVSAGRRTTSSSSWPKGSSMTMTFSQGMPLLAAQLGREAALLDHVRPEPGLAGDERDVQRAGEEPQAHHVVGVVLDLHLAALDRLAEADAGRGEAAVAAVGDVEAAHAAGADEHVERLAVGVRHQVQVLDAAAGDLVGHRHRVAGDGEAADADLVAVVDEPLDGFADGHQLAVESVVLCHLRPPSRVCRGVLNRGLPSEHGASQLGSRA